MTCSGIIEISRLVFSGLRRNLKITILSTVFSLGITAVLFAQLPGDTLLWREIQNSGHTIVFAILTMVFIVLLRSLRPAGVYKVLTGYVITVAVMVAVAIVTELGQLLTHREPSLNDVVRDMAGMLLGLGLYACIDPCLIAPWRRDSHKLRISTLIFSCCLLTVSMFPLMHLAAAYLQRNDALPVIVDLRAGWSRPFLQMNQAELMQVTAPYTLTSGEYTAGKQRVSQLILDTGSYSGVSVVEPYPDWSAFKTLQLQIYSAQMQAFDLVIRIHDSQHNHDHADRFNQSLTLLPGNNTFRIPLSDIERAPRARDMNLRQIASIQLFAVNLDNPVKFYPGIIKLE